MKHTILSVGVAACTILLAGSAALAQSKSACAPGKNKDALVAFYGADPEVGSPTPSGYITTLGGALSGGFYGNTSNSGNNEDDAPARGHGVNPSSSPGPQVIANPTPGTGTSIGDAIQALCPPS